MILKQVYLHNYRNYIKQTVAFHLQLTLVVGENARGKTNLLEAIYITVNGSGFRESKEEELIKWEEPTALVESTWEKEGHDYIFQIQLLKKGDSVEKKYYVNKTAKSHVFYAQQQTRSVLFAPEQIEIITGSPTMRRSYFDRIICGFDLEYRKKLHNYEHALRKRNKILEFHKNQHTLREELSFWDDYLEKHATYITQKRQEYVSFLNNHPHIENKRFEIQYLANEFTFDRLIASHEEEKRWRKTQIGPQKDDFVIFLYDDLKENVQLFGSRSEQRLAVLWLKLNEVYYIESILQKKPIILLDDIFSELDTKNKKLIFTLIHGYQSVLTTTEAELLDVAGQEKAVVKI